MLCSSFLLFCFSFFNAQLIERSKNIDVEDYDRMKNLVREMQVGSCFYY